jgi:hypothetical protein
MKFESDGALAFTSKLGDASDVLQNAVDFGLIGILSVLLPRPDADSRCAQRLRTVQNRIEQGVFAPTCAIVGSVGADGFARIAGHLCDALGRGDIAWRHMFAAPPFNRFKASFAHELQHLLGGVVLERDRADARGN